MFNPDRKDHHWEKRKLKRLPRPTPSSCATTVAKIDLPPAVARAFVKDMQAFFEEENRYKPDVIAAN